MTSPDRIGDLADIFQENYGGAAILEGIYLRAAIVAVEKAINERWFAMLPPGALVCGCGDIEVTEHECSNCQMVGWVSKVEGNYEE